MSPTTASHLATLLSEDEFLDLGLTQAGIHGWRKHKLHASIDRFKSRYGCSPKTCEVVWIELRNSNDIDIRITKRDKPLMFLLALRFLWKYETEYDLGDYFNIRSEKTVRNYYRHWLPKIQGLLKQKVMKWGCCFT